MILIYSIYTCTPPVIKKKKKEYFLGHLLFTLNTLHSFLRDEINYFLSACHTVGEEPPEVSGDNLHPPLKMLQIVSHWVESCPSYLFPGQLLDQHNTTKLPLINSNSSYQSLDFYSSRSPLVGLIQWCIITPLTAALNLYGQKSHKDELLQSPRLKSPDFAFDPFNNSTNNRTDQMAAKTVKSTRDVGSMVANLHAKLLSLILSGPLPQLTGGKHSHLISGDDMRTVVSTLLSYKQKLLSVELSRTVMSSLVSWTEESVERLAQFLQILLSTSLLSMKHGGCAYTCIISNSMNTMNRNRLMMCG